MATPLENSTTPHPAEYSPKVDTPRWMVQECVVSNINTTYRRHTIYTRAVKIERDGEQYGTYYQAVRSYREKGKVKQVVVHLGEHETAEAALNAWPEEVKELERIGRPKQAQKVQDKLDRLQDLTERE
jgi:hypothetical protein